ncbi:hypothetical protein PHYSODRAFT_307909 [Phytophthora sojae]|uniref:Uncharacterized protein n=1 Tax=Phytophthora sojae (strain P6497) TaxID=1094619 RepID=G5AGU8_PHYSP|nr:hypothetical protein PHYSODRAFT_301635 [Phytophthora sojae]XP_009539299.1 hypothetical protein PHYSODRAFT_307909 [Phytophthora sojae]EGZ05141.1 hypothetical protein PHYSODRAFT_307909 [Phytophthora sojae]EGZ14826.1 hypothetical protein PHYSODRAFT_301635 [Phytophthora sojae]|eukprot:XP_009528575.1 hypothetical protein PHYSODRAFT_301635 [Phytophthora sojae]
MLNADDYHDLRDLLHYCVDEHFQKESIVFASQYVQESVYNNLRVQNEDKLYKFIAVSDGVAAVDLLRGLLSDEYAHSMVGTRIHRLVNDQNDAKDGGPVVEGSN